MAETKRKYRSVEKRLKGVKDRPLTEREVRIIEAVYQFRVMNLAQVQQLFFASNASRTPVTRTLTGLFDRKYLYRRARETTVGRGENLYLIDRRGAELLREELGYTDIKFHATYKSLSSGYMKHLVAVGDFRIIVSEACQRYGIALEWIPEISFRSENGYDKVLLDGEPTGLIPDGAFCLIRGERKSVFFLELDRTSEKLSRYRDKCRLYLNHVRSDAYFTRFAGWLSEDQLRRRAPSMRVLTVITGEGRTERAGLDRLTSLMSEIEHPSVQTLHPARRFWFARLSDLSAENVFSEPIWSVKPEEPPAILLEEFETNQHIRHPKAD